MFAVPCWSDGKIGTRCIAETIVAIERSAAGGGQYEIDHTPGTNRVSSKSTDRKRDLQRFAADRSGAKNYWKGRGRAGPSRERPDTASGLRGTPASSAETVAAGDGLVYLLVTRYVYPNCISQPGPAMTSSTVFTSNRSQAVRLPKAVAFPEDVHQVDILKIGRSRVIVPKGRRWDDLFLSGPRVSEDFMSEREQPAAEEREPF